MTAVPTTMLVPITICSTKTERSNIFTSTCFSVNIYDRHKQNIHALVFDRALNFRFLNRFIKSNIFYVLNIKNFSFKWGQSRLENFEKREIHGIFETNECRSRSCILRRHLVQGTRGEFKIRNLPIILRCLSECLR